MAAPDSRYVEIPDEYAGPGPAVFLAGGITGCPDWQAQARQLLADVPVTLINPRWPVFPIDDPDAGPGQIAWEFRHIRAADLVLFWFPDSGPTIPQPIALYELGYCAAAGRPMVVGADSQYVRCLDVVLQLGHARPELAVWSSLKTVCGEVARWAACWQPCPSAVTVPEFLATEQFMARNFPPGPRPLP